MTLKHITIVKIIVCCALLFTYPASAEEPPADATHRWLVLQLDAQGFDSATISRFNEVLRETVATYVPDEHTLLPKPQMELQSLAVAAGCKMRLQHCVLPIAKMIGAQTVLYGKMVGNQERGELTLFFADVESQKQSEITSVMTDIRLSSEAEFRHHVEVALGSDRKMPTGSLRFEGLSESVEYRYYIDGNEVSQAKLEELAFGNHELVILAPSGEFFEWKGLVRPNQATILEVAFRSPPSLDAAPSIWSDYVLTWSFAISSGVAGILGGSFGLVKRDAYHSLEKQQLEISERCLAMGANCTAATICEVDNPPQECDTLSQSDILMKSFFYASGALALGTGTVFLLEYLNHGKSTSVAYLPSVFVSPEGFLTSMAWSF
ncbi:MAG: hypothetical protein VYC39_11440 [Myxococcota bacterium]|nr:hypothetical protein [Myxococcota bacterium]